MVKNKSKNRRKYSKVNQKLGPKEKTICKYPQELKDMSINWKRLALKLNDNKTKDKNVIKKDNKNVVKRDAKLNKGIESKPKDNKIWFDGVDNCLIKSSMSSISDTNVSNNSDEKLVKDRSFTGLTKIVGMDCEMVGTGSDGSTSVLARVSIVNFFGHCIYDKYVKSIEDITDYRTAVSGVRPSNLVNALDFKTVQKEVHQILKDRTVVGHAVKNDFQALLMSHPKHKTRDTSRYFRKLFGGRNPALKRLSETVLGVKIQSGEHDSVEDARVAMRLYTMYRKKWESDLNRNKTKRLKNK